MQIKGWRKLAMSALFGGAIIAVPNMTDVQVHLMETLIVAAFAGNGIEHLKETMQSVRIPGGAGGSPIRSVTDISRPQEERPDVNTH